MPSQSASSSVQTARQLLADRLREFRELRGWSLREHARMCGWSPSKSSRIEGTRTMPTPGDILTWCRVCEVADEAPELIASLRAVHTMFVEWHRMERTGLKHAQQSLAPLMERTRTFRTYSPNFVPGMLQSRAYTTAVLRAVQRRRVARDDVEEAVEVRMERQRILYEGRAAFAFVIEESVLYDSLAGDDVQEAQLGTLLAVMRLPNVSLGIIPKQRNRGRMPVEGFALFDDTEALVELVSGHLTITQPRELRLYEQAYAELAAMAVRGTGARALIAKAVLAFG